MATQYADISAENLMGEGGTVYDSTYTTTAIIPTRSISNPLKRERTTFSCLSSQNGTWIIYDVDRKGRRSQIISIPVTADTLSIYTHVHVLEYAWMTFTPAAGPGNAVIRAIPGGGGGSP